MNKAELIAAVAEKAGLSKKDTEKVINAAFDTITDELVAGEKVSLVGFGSFDVRNRAERTGRNPVTREEITIPASRTPSSRPARPSGRRRQVNMTGTEPGPALVPAS